MAIQGVDYAWERPDPKALWVNGIRFACRYLSHNTTGKNITAAELKALHSLGIAVVLNWEYDPYAPLKGFHQGAEDARYALIQAGELGAPAHVPVYFSVDFPATESQMPAILDYLAGAVSVLGHDRVGVYGGHRVVQYAADTGVCRWLWQTYAWSAGVWDGRAHIEQYHNGVTVAGAVVDLNRAKETGYGQWEPNEGKGTDMDEAQEHAEVVAGDMTPDNVLHARLRLLADNTDALALAEPFAKDLPTAPGHEQLGAMLRDVLAQARGNGAGISQVTTLLQGQGSTGVDVRQLAHAIVDEVIARLKSATL